MKNLIYLSTFMFLFNSTFLSARSIAPTCEQFSQAAITAKKEFLASNKMDKEVKLLEFTERAIMAAGYCVVLYDMQVKQNNGTMGTAPIVNGTPESSREAKVFENMLADTCGANAFLDGEEVDYAATANCSYWVMLGVGNALDKLRK